MRLPEPAAWQFLFGPALLLLAYGLPVGSGFELHGEHDQDHRKIVLISVIMAIGGVFLLWCSLRKPSQR